MWVRESQWWGNRRSYRESFQRLWPCSDERWISFQNAHPSWGMQAGGKVQSCRADRKSWLGSVSWHWSVRYLRAAFLEQNLSFIAWLGFRQQILTTDPWLISPLLHSLSFFIHNKIVPMFSCTVSNVLHLIFWWFYVHFLIWKYPPNSKNSTQ